MASTLRQSEDPFHRQLTQILPAHLADELAKHHTSVSYMAGSILISQGSLTDLVFWIVSGVVKLYWLAPKADRVLARLAGPGDLLGYRSLVGSDGQLSQPFDVQALTNCTVAMFSRDTMSRAIEKLEQPALLELFDRLNQSSSSLTYRLLTFLGCSFRRRLELTFWDLACKFGVEDQRGFLVNLKLSHTDFAEMIGCSRPMATVLIGEMIADGSLYRQDQQQYVVPRPTMRIPTGNGSGAASPAAPGPDCSMTRNTAPLTNGPKVRYLKRPEPRA